MEIITNALSTAQFKHEINEIITFLNAKGIADLTVMYGCACNLEQEKLYQEIPLSTEKLKLLITQSIENGVFEIGQCDLFIPSEKDGTEFLLCYEFDIHFKTTNTQWLKEMQLNWQAKGYKWYEAYNS